MQCLAHPVFKNKTGRKLCFIYLLLLKKKSILFIFPPQWNDVISAFRQGVPRGRHRRYMRTAEDCFAGSSAVDWLLEHVKKRRDFGSNVTRYYSATQAFVIKNVVHSLTYLCIVYWYGGTGSISPNYFF